jgi:hypothetical protein
VFAAAGHLLQHDPSTADVDSYVSGYSLVGGAAPRGLGLNLVWGNEGQFDPNAVGGEAVLGTKQFGIYQTYSYDTSDPQFWQHALGLPVDAS